METGGAGQTTTRAYDANGNVLTVTDGLNHTTTNAYDALNRLTSSTDANSGITTPAYDAHDRIVSVTDANGNTTSYVRDGFGDVIQQTSPDSGTTVFHFDGDANLTSKTDALGIVTNQTFDALDRPLTTTYPSDPSENVTYTYDQTGSPFAFGIGRLTSVTDAAGSLTRIYEERGNLVTEKRVNGKTTLTTGYTYDGAGRISLMSYPDGTLVGYQRDPAGFVTTVLAQLPGASTVTTIATLTHLPLGPIYNLVFGNNIQQRRYYDASYRPTIIGVTDANLQVLNYTYDNANNIVSIKDSLNAANSQTFSYDAVNRLISAASGTGGYGGYSWTYDKVGNRLTQVLNSTHYHLRLYKGHQPSRHHHDRHADRTPESSCQAKGWKRHSTPRLKPTFSQTSSSTPATPQPHRTESPTRSMLAAVLGWPMLVLGFAGIVSFRRRLLGNMWLTILIAAALCTGGTTLLLGCGSFAQTSADAADRSHSDLLPRCRDLYLSAERHHLRLDCRSHDLFHDRWHRPDRELDKIHSADIGFLHGNTKSHCGRERLHHQRGRYRRLHHQYSAASFACGHPDLLARSGNLHIRPDGHPIMMRPREPRYISRPTGQRRRLTHRNTQSRSRSAARKPSKPSPWRAAIPPAQSPPPPTPSLFPPPQLPPLRHLPGPIHQPRTSPSPIPPQVRASTTPLTEQPHHQLDAIHRRNQCFIDGDHQSHRGCERIYDEPDCKCNLYHQCHQPAPASRS